MTEPIQYSIDAKTGIATITFSRPDVLNAIDLATARSFRLVAEAAAADPQVRCIILIGAGRAFVAGGDVAAFAANIDDASGLIHGLLDGINPAILALRRADAPVLALVRGPAAGAGLSLVLGADFVLAADNAIFQIAYDKIGAQPDCGGTWFLERRVGRGKAFELMLSGRRLNAQEAASLGIVNEVVADAELEARGLSLAQTIASGPTRAFGQFKRLIDGAPARSLDEQLEAERVSFVAATATEDFKVGVSAFVAKAKPIFTGR